MAEPVSFFKKIIIFFLIIFTEKLCEFKKEMLCLAGIIMLFEYFFYYQQITGITQNNFCQ
jgi:hypothetical protein